MFRTPEVPILLNRRTNRTSADLEREQDRQRFFRAYALAAVAYAVIIATTIALTHSWLPYVQ